MLKHTAALDHELKAVNELLGQPEVEPAEVQSIEEGLKLECSELRQRAIQFQLTSDIEWQLDHGF